MEVVILGSGSLATHLALAFQSKGLIISQIYSRTSSNAKLLADRLNTSYTDKISEINKNADIYFYCTNDSSFQNLLKTLDFQDALHVHTSGSTPLSDFEKLVKNCGAFYPLQTFSKRKVVDFSLVPICIEACNQDIENKLLDLAHLISSKTYLIDSVQRKKLHLAAVFACNFTNFMYNIAYDIVNSAEIEFEILQPLIDETALKVKILKPFEAQTGPAVRYDKNTIKKHISMLKNESYAKDIYKSISKDIFKKHKSQKI